MIEKDFAFILKRFFPHKQKVCALTYAHGKINIVIPQKDLCAKLWPGMIVSLPLQTHELKNPNPKAYGSVGGTGFVCSQGEILYTPLIEEESDLYWLHHLLELGYYFLPLNDPNPEAFNHFCNYFALLTQKKYFKKYNTLLHKLSVLHFLFLMGMGQAHKNNPKIDALFPHLVALFAQKELNSRWEELLHDTLGAVTSGDHAYINRCIQHGMQNHPCHKQFKTKGNNAYDY